MSSTAAQRAVAFYQRRDVDWNVKCVLLTLGPTLDASGNNISSPAYRTLAASLAPHDRTQDGFIALADLADTAIQLGAPLAEPGATMLKQASSPAPVAIAAEPPVAPSADDIAAAHLAAVALLTRLGIEPDGEVVCRVADAGPAIDCFAWANGDWVRLVCDGGGCSPRGGRP